MYLVERLLIIYGSYLKVFFFGGFLELDFSISF